MSDSRPIRTTVRPTKGFPVKKTNSIISSLFVAAIALTAATGAQSQSPDYALSRSGNSFTGFSAGLTEYKLNDGTGVFGSDKRTTTYNLYVGGYFENSNLGTELGYTDFGKITRAGGTTKADGVNLSLIGRIPLGDTVNLLGKVGTTYSRTDVSSAAGSGVTAGNNSGFDWSYGLGVELALARAWSAVLKYDEHYMKFAGDARDRINVTSLGLRYRY